MTIIVCALLAYTLAREILFWVTAQKLLNKAMSRNYAEYKQAEVFGKPAEPKKVNEEFVEDLNELVSII